MLHPSVPPAVAILSQVEQLCALKLRALFGILVQMFCAPGSSFSLLSLACALGVATIALWRQRRARGRRLGFNLAVRALFPRWLTHSASTKADLGFFLLNVFAVSGLIGWALIGFGAVHHSVLAALTHQFGLRAPIAIDPKAATAIMTLALFLAYELAYWIDHYTNHAIPFFWAFHRVHHTAETLTPLTVFRVHPIDTLKFYNITALVTGAISGLGAYMLGRPVGGFGLDGSNIILLAFIFLTIHLQHSHIWIAFTGPLGRILASPAHHQIHHSADPADFGKNLGSSLALFDWLFGTLRLPQPRREAIIYGVEPEGEDPHSITGGLITPFGHAAASLRNLGAPLVPQPELKDQSSPT